MAAPEGLAREGTTWFQTLLGLMLLLAWTLTAVPCAASPQNLLLNASLEQGPPIPSGQSYKTLTGGSTAIVGWTVTGNNIDYIGPGWSCADGVRAVDLDGAHGTGGIRQSFSTTAGATYAVSFKLAGNPEGDPVVKTVRVSIDAYSHDFTVNPSGQTRSTLAWNPESFEFVASGVSATLSFVSLDPSNGSWGPIIDDIVAVEIRQGCQGAPELESLITAAGPQATCTPGNILVHWAEFGDAYVLTADSGEELKVVCNDNPRQFRLLYYPTAGAQPIVAAKCVWEGGFNRAWFWHTGDSDHNGQPDCLIGTVWNNRDYGNNDCPDSYLDWLWWGFNCETRQVSLTRQRYEYRPGEPPANGPPPHEGAAVGPEIAISESALPPQCATVGPTMPLEDPPDTLFLSLDPVCDQDGDGDCDAQDQGMAESAVGACLGELGYTLALDLNQDGCISEDDVHQIFASAVSVAKAPAFEQATSVQALTNPVRGSCRLRARLDASGVWRVVVFDGSGRLVSVLARSWMPAGEHVFEWKPSAAGIKPGVYLLQVSGPRRSGSTRVVVLH